MKETFIIRTEWYESIGLISVEEQAEIFRNLFLYHLGEELTFSTLNVKMFFSLIIPNLARNISEYDKRRDTSAKNGILGGRPKKENKKPNKPNSITYKPNETLSVIVTDSVSVIDTVLDNVIDNDLKEKNIKKEFFDFSNLDLKKKNIALTKTEYEKLISDFGETATNDSIIFLSDYKIEKKYKTQSDNLTIRRWVIDAVKKTKKTNSFGGILVSELEKYSQHGR
jgi:hypothetical protein